ncbi:hypothetical protein [Microbulbifer litoralis]|nr:hypothetical protein [Microbulbifer sp. GX H0434]
MTWIKGAAGTTLNLFRRNGRAVEILDLMALSELTGTHCSYDGDE